MTDYAIEARGLTKSFGTKAVLRELSVRIPHGGVHALVGSNGAGKTTLFRILLGFERPDAGSAHILGTAANALDAATRGRIGIVHEEHALPGWHRVADAIALQRALSPRWNDSRFDEVVSSFRIEERQKISQLSRGERAGLSLALALAQSPDLLILDEPTLGLDVVSKRSFLTALVRAAADTDATIVYCSHQMDEVERLADNLIILQEGRVVHVSPPEFFCERVRCYIVTGHPASWRPAGIPHVLERTTVDGEHHLTLWDPEGRGQQALLNTGAARVRVASIGLDRAVGAFLRKRVATFSSEVLR